MDHLVIVAQFQCIPRLRPELCDTSDIITEINEWHLFTIGMFRSHIFHRINSCINMFHRHEMS
jgi:hypothetical protein